MRLLTHNYLQSTVKGTTKGYPLIIRPTVVVIEESSEVDVEMIQRILSKIDYTVLKEAYQQIYPVAAETAATTTTTTSNIHLPPTLPDEIPNEISLEISKQQLEQNMEDQVNDDNDEDNENDYDTNNETDITTTTTTTTTNELFYQTLFTALFEIHIMEGILICPDTQREFPIKDGIPNMILHEDEL